MSIALILLAIIYILFSVRYFKLLLQIEKAFSSLTLPVESNFVLGKGIAILFFAYGFVLIGLVLMKRLDAQKKKIIFLVSLILLFVVGGRFLGGIAVNTLPQLFTRYSSPN